MDGSEAADRLGYKYSFMIGSADDLPESFLDAELADFGFRSKQINTLYDLL